MDSPPGLAPDYPTARQRFLGALGGIGAQLTGHAFPDTGPAGEELATDIAWIGAADADAIVLVVSGTHGVEGYAGSMCQSRWLGAHGAEPLPAGVALVLVHAFNPYGFAWVRRMNEDNVDLNRNFSDLDNPPANPAYDELAATLAPPTWDDDTQAATMDTLVDYVTAHGMDALQAAISGGQYAHPDGLFYGGTGPARSQRIMRVLIEERLSSTDRVVILDLHTGLGEPGEVEIISADAVGSPSFRRARSWFGDRVESIHSGESVSAELAGEWMTAAEQWLAPAEVTAVALEWGTTDIISVMQALRADNWLHNHGDPTGPDAPAIKADLRAAFAPDDPAWADAVYTCFEEALANALTAVSSPA